jgi:outer membrane protein OmpA-like peptidoglycan-associated protein
MRLPAALKLGVAVLAWHCSRGGKSGSQATAGQGQVAAMPQSDSGPSVVPLLICRHPQDDLPAHPYSGPAWAGGVEGDTVPLRVGLIVVTAIAMPNGDYESLKVVDDKTDDGIVLSYQADVPAYDTATRGYKPKTMHSARFVFNDDQNDGCAYAPDFHDQSGSQPPPDTLVGATTITLSARMLGALKTGQTEYLQIMTHTSGFPDEADGHWMHLASTQPVGVRLLLGGEQVMLPALHAVCNADSLAVSGARGDSVVMIETPCEYLILDDAKNPLVLSRRIVALGRKPAGGWQLDTEEIRVVKLAYNAAVGGGGGGPGGPPGNGGGGGAGGGAAEQQEEQRMQDSLAARKKVLVYGIYFDFAKANIKKESDPVLREIADLMRKNPTWALAINGYTDSIGGDAYNLDLSRRRAAAVKDTLVSGYRIDAKRLTTAGFGAASPVDSNSTLEGRARNRRVELVR